jgi:hypothetical protein
VRPAPTGKASKVGCLRRRPGTYSRWMVAPADVLARLAADLAEVLGDDLLSLALHGSWALDQREARRVRACSTISAEDLARRLVWSPSRCEGARRNATNSPRPYPYPSTGIAPQTRCLREEIGKRCRLSMAKVVVRLDREPRRLEPDDAAARRVWLTQHLAQWPGHRLPVDAHLHRADEEEAGQGDGGAADQRPARYGPIQTDGVLLRPAVAVPRRIRG